MDESQHVENPESYFRGGRDLFTDGGQRDRPRSPAPAAPSVPTIVEPARETPVHEETDVLVVGGGPAGTAAALAARRLGQRVTLVERYGDLGGLSAGGLVIWIDRMTDWEGTPVIAGIGAELLERLPEGALAGPGPELWGSTDPEQVAHWRERLSAFRDTVCRSPMIDPEWLKIVSHEALVGEGVRVLLHSWVVAAITDGEGGEGGGGTVRGAIFESKQGRRAILAKVVVDATGDLDVVAQAGGAFVTDALKDGTGGNVQHTINTAFTWTGVDMNRWLEFKRADPAGHQALMNRGRELLGYLDTPHVGWRDDVVVFMGPRMSGYSGIDVEDLSTVELESRRRMVAHLDFFRREAPGFEGAWIMLAAPQIGVRMTRRLAGLHPITTDEWRAGVRHPDEIGVSPSPSQKFATISVPYRALVPRRLDGVVVGGRHVASDAPTQAFMREIPQCWMTGQAAGTAAALAAGTGTALRALDVEEVRRELRGQGAFLHGQPTAAAVR
ncbi:FAD-dependent oxidoreductase [Pseudonocardia lacus]|uniref:FAD-dependent oxidoreductase n=1 Tax=Pseudonocardia lacus TaxID=2835865 RepID=UPI001BDBC973|nr:FAD-dependent oxidoreductase [Pseudonocardia lacus]